MKLSHDEVREILDLVERTDVEYLELELDGTRIVADKTGAGSPSGAVSPSGAASARSGQAEAGLAPLANGSAPLDTDVVIVEAPVVGVFYRAPEPGAAPFTEVGEPVEAEATVGLVEVMKMFNSVTSGVSGRVVEILADNEQFVEYGQPLMTIRPEAE